MAATDETRADDAKRLAEERDARRLETQQKMDEQRKARLEADEKRRAEEFAAQEERLAEARKQDEARRKERERRAALSPAERLAEDEKRAAMTPEDRAADDEAKGLGDITPEQFDQINQLAATSQFPVKTESVPHAAGFILSEANGQRSRENGQFLDPATIVVGQPVAISAPASGMTPATYIPVVTTAGATCAGLAIYGGSTNGTTMLLSVLARDAEVNKNLIAWGTLLAADQAACLTALAGHNVVAR